MEVVTVMKNSYVDTRLSLVLWLLLQLQATLRELVSQINVPAARVGRDAEACAACESSVWHGCQKGWHHLACLQGAGAQIREAVGLLCSDPTSYSVPDGCLISGSRRGKGWNQRRGAEDLQEPWLRTV